REENRCQRCSETGDPNERTGQNCRVRKDLADKRKNDEYSCMGMTGSEEVLTQRVFHVAAVPIHKGRQQKVPTILNRRDRYKDDTGDHSGFIAHLLGSYLEF